MPSNAEMINNLIDIYATLQSIKNAENSEQKLEYHSKIIKAKLRSFGISTNDLDRKPKEK